MTLGCLAPYRRRGIGCLMLQHVLNYVEKDSNFHSIFLYVRLILNSPSTLIRLQFLS